MKKRVNLTSGQTGKLKHGNQSKMKAQASVYLVVAMVMLAAFTLSSCKKDEDIKWEPVTIIPPVSDTSYGYNGNNGDIPNDTVTVIRSQSASISVRTRVNDDE